MKIVPDDAMLESGICDLHCMAEIVSSLLADLPERLDAKRVPKDFMENLECVTFAAFQLRDMTAALKVEFYADCDRNEKIRAA